MDLSVLKEINTTLSEVADDDLRGRLEDLVAELLKTTLTEPRKRELGKYVEKICQSTDKQPE